MKYSSRLSSIQELVDVYVAGEIRMMGNPAQDISSIQPMAWQICRADLAPRVSSRGILRMPLSGYVNWMLRFPCF